jgi:hypothetical protein
MIVSLSRELDLRWKLSSLRSGIIKEKVKDKFLRVETFGNNVLPRIKTTTFLAKGFQSSLDFLLKITP